MENNKTIGYTTWDIKVVELRKDLFEFDFTMYNFLRFSFELSLMLENFYAVKWYKPSTDYTRVQVRSMGSDIKVSEEVLKTVHYLETFDFDDTKDNRYEYQSVLNNFKKTINDFKESLK